MALKFLYLVNDPFINQSEEFVRILTLVRTPSFSGGAGTYAIGELFDPNGYGVGQVEFITGSQATEATAYPYTFAAGLSASQIVIVPPGWTFENFGRALAVQGTLEEVLRVH
jgi:hypothetical protein